MQAIQELDFAEDTCNITHYIEKIMQNNGISKITERPDISPAFKSLPQHSEPTAASVERSFSMLQKLLSKNIKFMVENEKQFIILHLNFCT